MLLNKFLHKLGLQSYTQLNDEERKTYKDWEEALSGRRLTDEDVKVFFETQIEDTMVKLISTKITDKEDTFLKMKLELIRAVQTFLDSPRIEKKMVEKSIENAIEKL